MNDHMTDTDYWLREVLLKHKAHDISIVTYGPKTWAVSHILDPWEVSLECNTCFEVITTYALDTDDSV